MLIISQVVGILLPYSNCFIDGAGKKESCPSGGACVKPDYADFVGMTHEKGIHSLMRGILADVSVSVLTPSSVIEHCQTYQRLPQGDIIVCAIG
jgi:hypothetical protein